MKDERAWCWPCWAAGVSFLGAKAEVVVEARPPMATSCMSMAMRREAEPPMRDGQQQRMAVLGTRCHFRAAACIACVFAPA